MKSISIILIPFFLLLMIGCENNVTNPAGMSDAELIQAIISASKVDISMTELPDQSQTIVENDYNDYDGLGAKKASGLGYEVELAGRGHRFGDRNEVYFNLKGKSSILMTMAEIKMIGIEIIRMAGNVLTWFCQ